MNSGVMVVMPRGRASEMFADVMVKEISKWGDARRIGFAYPYLPVYKVGNPALLQSISAVVRDGLVAGVEEFLVVDTGVLPVLSEISGMLPENTNPIVYNVVDEARSFFKDPTDRPVWLDRWENMKLISGFETFYSKDHQDLQEMLEEVFWRCRGVTGGMMEECPEKYKSNVLNEEFLRSRSAHLLLKLADIDTPKGILLGNIELAVALTRYIEEEFREILNRSGFVNLATVLGQRLI